MQRAFNTAFLRDDIVACSDHRQVEQLFKRLEKAAESAHRTKRALVGQRVVGRVREEVPIL